MKKSILLMMVIALFARVSAQTVVLDGESNVVYGNSSNASEELDLGWDVICNESATTDIKCIATVLEITQGAQYQYCWGAACSPWIAVNGNLNEIVTMDPQESNSTFHVKYRHYGNAGQTVIRFCWVDASDATNSFCYDLAFCANDTGDCVVGVSEAKTSATIAQISPNPANDQATISYELSARPNNAQLTVYNMLGELVQTYTLNQRVGQIRVQTKELSNGIYFCTLMHDGKKYETKRLVVHH